LLADNRPEVAADKSCAAVAGQTSRRLTTAHPERLHHDLRRYPLRIPARWRTRSVTQTQYYCSAYMTVCEIAVLAIKIRLETQKQRQEARNKKQETNMAAGTRVVHKDLSPCPMCLEVIARRPTICTCPEVRPDLQVLCEALAMPAPLLGRPEQQDVVVVVVACRAVVVVDWIGADARPRHDEVLPDLVDSDVLDGGTSKPCCWIQRPVRLPIQINRRGERQAV
jgi:hypothetical protein